jgi:hypothetical protein
VPNGEPAVVVTIHKSSTLHDAYRAGCENNWPEIEGDLRQQVIYYILSGEARDAEEALQQYSVVGQRMANLRKDLSPWLSGWVPLKAMHMKSEGCSHLY